MITISNGVILWILNPKTGTRSIVGSKLFAGYAENYITGVDHPCFANLYKVAVVRNPFDRLVSCFCNKVEVGKDYGATRDIGAIPEHLRHSFPAFVRWLAEGDNLRSDIHWLPQSEYLPPPHQLDKIIRFENLRGGFAEVCGRMGVSYDLPVENVSKHGHYSNYFDAELVEVVDSLYAEDLQQFGYSFSMKNKASIGWDRYVENMVSQGKIPGDEWADGERWESVFQGFLSRELHGEVKKFVEIGQGSGKYTLMALACHSPDLAICCDISEGFLEYCKRRVTREMPGATVRYELLTAGNVNGLSDCVLKHTEQGTVDLVFSIDTMVHVEAPMLLNYLLNANKVLRLGGSVVMQVANGGTSEGITRMMEDIAPLYGGDEHFEGKFQWVTPTLITLMASRAGFEMTLMTCENGVDLYFSARKVTQI